MVGILFLVSSAVLAEPSFSDVESLIERKQFAAAEQGLAVIIKNHPQSAKAYYAMAQAQAGLGNLEKAQYAMNKARGLDPNLNFASSSNVENLEQAIEPQVQKIDVVSDSHMWRNLFILLAIGVAGWIGYTYWKRKQDEVTDVFEFDDLDYATRVTGNTPTPKGPTLGSASVKPTQSYSRHTTYNSGYTPRSTHHTPVTPPPQYPNGGPSTTVINNGSHNDGFFTGMMVGSLLSDHHDHHDHTTIIERDVYHDTTNNVDSRSSRDSSWDNDYTPSSSSSSTLDSSWDDTSSTLDSSWDDSSSSRSSSWDSDSSSSSSSSSWDSDSSSSRSSSDW